MFVVSVLRNVDVENGKTTIRPPGKTIISNGGSCPLFKNRKLVAKLFEDKGKLK